MTRGELMSRMSDEEFHHWMALRLIESSEQAGRRAGAKPTPKQDPPPGMELWQIQHAMLQDVIKAEEENRGKIIRGAPL